jgi:hypothetical protein
MAQKWKVPVLSVDYICKCEEAGKLLEVDPYVVVGRTASEEFSSGKIVGESESWEGGSDREGEEGKRKRGNEGKG